MNKQLQQYARKHLKEKVSTLPEAHQLLFKLMYSHTNIDLSIEKIIDNMDETKLDNAMHQAEKTLKKKGVRNGE